MKTSELLKKALCFEDLTIDEGLYLYTHATTNELMLAANRMRFLKKNSNIVSWIIDRNVNITNICYSQCKFCNFYRKINDPDTYITNTEEYRQKIKELKSLGGNQLLLQGGLHPKLGLAFYSDLFKELKTIEPELKLHALGPPEIVHIAKLEKKSVDFILDELIKSGLDSLPGAGAEILTDRVRSIVSPAKCSSQEWLDVMEIAHKKEITTSATMMFGHVENPKERIEHLIKIRDVQHKKPINAKGFIAFIPWPFMDEGTELLIKHGIKNTINAEEYIRIISISRLLLHNIDNIQASWLTVGKDVGELCLHAGANDFGSIMIEENVVSSAGAHYKFDAEGIQKAIIEAGFVPQFRDQQYNYIDVPANVCDLKKRVK